MFSPMLDVIRGGFAPFDSTHPHPSGGGEGKFATSRAEFEVRELTFSRRNLTAGLRSAPMNTFNVLLSRAAVAFGAVSVAAVGFSGMAAAQPPPPPADPDAVPPALLDTNCSLDQLLAATKVVDPVTYGALIERYNSEPVWLQPAIINHLNLLLDKAPADRQAEVDELARLFPQFVPLFATTESNATEIADKCPSFPAEDPAVLAMP